MSLWLVWYGFAPQLMNQGGDGESTVLALGSEEEDDPYTAWHVFTFVDVALAALSVALIAATTRTAAVWAWRLLAIAMLALVVFRMVAPPWDALEASWGAIVALTGGLLASVLAWLPRPDAAC